MPREEKNVSNWCAAKTLVLGCGNKLFGDDGFGPAVVEHLLQNYVIPDWALVEDVGTGVREVLFDISLSDIYPSTVVIIDSVDKGFKPGAIFEITSYDLPKEKIDNFRLHNAPSSNLIKQLEREKGDIELYIYVCQIKEIPNTMRMELSPELKEAVKEMGTIIYHRFLS
ncbi:MAG: coenzyme F420-reducing hydrogenase, FrhD protein [Myxococcota bacterium]